MIKFCSLGFWYAPGDVGLSLSAVLPRKQTPPICHFLLPSASPPSFPLFLLFFLMLAVTVSYCHQSKVSQQTAICSGFIKIPHIGQCLNNRLAAAHGSGCWLFVTAPGQDSSRLKGVQRPSLHSWHLQPGSYMTKGTGSFPYLLLNESPHTWCKFKQFPGFCFLRLLDYTIWMQTFGPQQFQQSKREHIQSNGHRLQWTTAWGIVIRLVPILTCLSVCRHLFFYGLSHLGIFNIPFHNSSFKIKV